MNIKMGTIPNADEALVGNILVKEGDAVKAGQTLLEYESDKGVQAVESPIAGVITKVLCEVSDTIAVDQLIFEIAEEDEIVTTKNSALKTIHMETIEGGDDAVAGKIEVVCGDHINEGDELFSYESGKGSRSYESSVTGRIVKIYVEEGEKLEVDSKLFDVSLETETVEDEASNSFQDEKNINADILIIGGGPGGYVAAIYAAKHGKKVVLLEKESLGGTCLNVGCIPTKALVKSSEVRHSAMHSETFGIHIDKNAIEVDMDEIINHKDSVVARLVGGVGSLMKANKVTVIKGCGTFVSQNRVEVIANNIKHNIEATDIVIATGSKISKINIPGLDLPIVWNSTTALSNHELPKSIAIIGGGVIGMEFAFIYNNLGVEVTVIEYMDRLLTMLDKEESEEIKKIAISRGIKVFNNAKVMNVGCDVRNKAIVTFEKDDTDKLLVADNVLVAIGREPNMEGLNLEVTGVEVNPKSKGIVVDDTMKTNVEHIYAIGDVTNIIQLAHVASHQGIVAIDNILGNDARMHYNAVPNVIFTAPEIATVGNSEKECIDNKVPYKMSKFSYQSNGKAITMEETQGHIKLIENTETNELIGAAIIGADASNLISAITVAIQNRLSAEQVRATIFPHPTTSEVIHEAAMGLGIGTLHQ